MVLVKLNMAGDEVQTEAGDGLEAVSGDEDLVVLGVSEDVVAIVLRMMEKFTDCRHLGTVRRQGELGADVSK